MNLGRSKIKIFLFSVELLLTTLGAISTTAIFPEQRPKFVRGNNLYLV
jgi:hypothetical protein